ncbi:hypothetical protein DFJ74DRAFT_759211 [Hyaloraphidium curvatum]|nr:hypothetical protein DFJ74DRAFT_759211 [Hyaloraphidium curvatum]
MSFPGGAFALPTPLLTEATRRLASPTGLRGLRGAAVFVDASAAAALRWSPPGGLAGLLLERGGAASVQDISSIRLEDDDASEVAAEGAEDFEPLRPAQSRRAAFVVAAPLPYHLRRIRRALLSHGYEKCTVFSALDEAAHAQLAEAPYPAQGRERGDEDTGNEPEYARQLWIECRKGGGSWERDADDAYFAAAEMRLRHWLLEGRERHPPPEGAEPFGEPEVSVLHFPLALYAPISDRFLLLPASDMFPLLDPDRHIADQEPRLGNLSPVVQRRFLLAAGALSSLLDALDVQDHVYSAGRSAGLLARVLTTQFATTPRRRSSRTASLVILDRTLDIIPPASAPDNLLDQALAVLPRDTPYDASVPSDFLLPLFTPRLPLSHGMDPSKLPLLGTILSHPARESLARVRKKLADAVNRDGPEEFRTPGKLPGRVTAAQLNRLLSAFRGDEENLLRHAGAVEAAAIAAGVLQRQAGLEERLGTEKVLLLGLAQGDEEAVEGAVEQWRSLLPEETSSEEGRQKFAAAVGLLVNVWMRLPRPDRGLAGRVREALLKCLLAEPPASDDEAGEPEADEEFDADWGWGQEGGSSPPRAEKAPKPDAEDRYRAWKERKRTLEFEADVFMERLEALRRQQSRIFSEPGADYAPLVRRVAAELTSPRSQLASRAGALTSAASALGSWLQKPGEAAGGEELKHHSYGLISYAASSVAGGLAGVLKTVQTAAMKTIEPGGNKVLILFVLGGITGGEVQAAVEAWEASRGGVEELIVGSGSMAGDVFERLGGELLSTP